MKREINLNPEQVKGTLIQAKQTSQRDYLILKTTTIGDFRIGEVIGSAARLWVPYCPNCEWHFFSKNRCEKCQTLHPKKAGFWVASEPNLPGLLIEDLRDDGVWTRMKGWKKKKNPTPPKKKSLTPELIAELRQFIGIRLCSGCNHKHDLKGCHVELCKCEVLQGKIFDISWSRVWQFLHTYSQRAGLVDWKLNHSHRLRHYMTNQVGRKHGVLAARDIAGHKNLSTTNRYLAETPEEEKREIIGELAGILE